MIDASLQNYDTYPNVSALSDGRDPRRLDYYGNIRISVIVLRRKTSNTKALPIVQPFCTEKLTPNGQKKIISGCLVSVDPNDHELSVRQSRNDRTCWPVIAGVDGNLKRGWPVRYRQYARTLGRLTVRPLPKSAQANTTLPWSRWASPARIHCSGTEFDRSTRAGAPSEL